MISLLQHAHQLYATCGPSSRQILNSAVFQAFYIVSRTDGAAVGPDLANAPHTPVVDAVLTAGNERTLGEVLSPRVLA